MTQQHMSIGKSKNSLFHKFHGCKLKSGFLEKRWAFSILRTEPSVVEFMWHLVHIPSVVAGLAGEVMHGTGTDAVP